MTLGRACLVLALLVAPFGPLVPGVDPPVGEL